MLDENLGGESRPSRREVLAVTAGVAVVGIGGFVGAADVPGTVPARLPVRIGIFLSTFGGPFEKRLDGVKAAGLDCVQLSMGCLGMAPMPDRIEGDVIERVKREAGKRGIEIVSLQGTFNMGHPDAEFRAGGVRRLGVLASAAREMGTKLIHLCSGTRDRINMWRRHPSNGTPEAWRDMAGCMKDAVEAVKGAGGGGGGGGVTLAFEPEVNNIVDSAAKARKLLDEVGSAQLKVTMDGSNLFHTGEFARMGEILDEAFELVGKDVVM